MEDLVFSLEGKVNIYKDVILHARQDNPHLSEEELKNFIQLKEYELQMIKRTIELSKTSVGYILTPTGNSNLNVTGYMRGKGNFKEVGARVSL